MILEWSDSDKFKLIESAFSLSYSNPGPKGKMIGYYIEKISDIALEGLDERSKLYKIENEKSILEDFLNNINDIDKFFKYLKDEYKNIEFVTASDLVNEIKLKILNPLDE